MSTVRELLRQVRDGETTAEEVAPQIARIIREGSARRAAETEGLTHVEVIHMKMEGMLDDDPSDTFVPVQAAYFADELTDEQYAVITAAVVGEER
ncbi:hypothetical protein [Nocardioides solisilvae]|uniref:hypothetical protein n=1 Tax=Nocardioides solisilvae TaxID=1542435 RepID=UPI000D74E8E9|nr:hypothetical protein [Nocardioides solisilvae]